MIFPELEGRRGAIVNLNTEAIEWLKKNSTGNDVNPLLNPETCDVFVRTIHKKLGVDFSYGGWLEDRSTLWKGSYLDQWKTYIHLGIDINAPAGTLIAASFDATVIKIDDDYPENGGWGTRIILKHANKPFYFIYAHLDREIKNKVGDLILKDHILAKVGNAPYNGNWFPHLHVQCITEQYFKEIEENNLWAELDGYGHADETKIDALRFPDPTPFLSFE